MEVEFFWEKKNNVVFETVPNLDYLSIEATCGRIKRKNVCIHEVGNSIIYPTKFLDPTIKVSRVHICLP